MRTIKSNQAYYFHALRNRRLTRQAEPQSAWAFRIFCSTLKKSLSIIIIPKIIGYLQNRTADSGKQFCTVEMQ